MQTKSIVKKTIAAVICFSLLFLALSACSDTNAIPSDSDIEWIDPGVDAVSVKFEPTGENLFKIDALAAVPREQSGRGTITTGYAGVISEL